MIKNIKEHFKNLDKKIILVLKNGLKFCFFLCLLSTLILVIYKMTFISPFLYYIGITMFRLSTIFGVQFVICAFVMDRISKQTKIR